VIASLVQSLQPDSVAARASAAVSEADSSSPAPAVKRTTTVSPAVTSREDLEPSDLRNSCELARRRSRWSPKMSVSAVDRNASGSAAKPERGSQTTSSVTTPDKPSMTHRMTLPSPPHGMKTWHLAAPEAVSHRYSMTAVLSTYLICDPASEGAIRRAPPLVRSSNGHTTGGASNLPGQNHSIPPLGASSAIVCPSPIAPKEPMGG